jgi:pentatricopeptide repeat protein
MDMAVEVFGELSERDIISWNAVITGYSQHGHGQEVYGAFLEMLREGVSPNEVTFITVLKVCSDLVSVSYGKKIHVITRETSYACDAFVRSTLLDMYAKCGNIRDASSLFENTMDQDKVSCNVMMAGYAQHGFFNKALMIFHRMCLSDDKLDHITCISIICACNYIGLVSEGCTYFTCMMLDDGIKPSIETYGCLIDLIGRGGQLDVALHLAENLPCSPSVDIWMSLVSASKFCNNVDLAACAAEYVIEQEPGNTAAVLLLSNMIV